MSERVIDVVPGLVRRRKLDGRDTGTLVTGWSKNGPTSLGENHHFLLVRDFAGASVWCVATGVVFEQVGYIII